MYKTQFSSSGSREDLKNQLHSRDCFYAMLLRNSREKTIDKQDNNLTNKCNTASLSKNVASPFTNTANLYINAASLSYTNTAIS